jgi:hypothetical protein
MRFSCPGFARILDERGRYALLLNRKRTKKGRHVFSPVGGALQLNTSEDMHYLIEAFGASDFENGLDLRFQAPDDQEAEIKKWFHSDSSRQRCETSALRELKEELVHENKILTTKDLEGVCETFSHFCYRSALKQGTKAETRYIVEVYDIDLPVPTLAKLIENACEPFSKLYFANESEIKRGLTYSREEIGDITKTLLR